MFIMFIELLFCSLIGLVISIGLIRLIISYCDWSLTSDLDKEFDELENLFIDLNKK